MTTQPSVTTDLPGDLDHRTAATSGVDTDRALFVFHARTLRQGMDLGETARFDDDHWPLAPVSLQGHERGLTLRFDTVHAEHRRAIKRLCYLMLSGPLPPTELRPSINTVVTTFYNLRVFTRWLCDHPTENHAATLSEIGPDLLREYQQHLLHHYRSLSRRHALRTAVGMLWRYRDGLGVDGLRLDPRSVNGWHESLRAIGSENTTERIPEEVHTRLLVWAMRFVDQFSPDIIAAIERWDQLRTNPSRSRRRPGPGSAVDTAIASYLAQLREAGRALPGIGGQLSVNAIARAVGCDRRAVDRNRAAIEEVASVVGISDHACLDLSIRGQLDAGPWLDGISLDPARDDSLTVLTQMLQAACYIVIAFLSGMRDSEVKHLRSGCVTVDRDAQGRAYRWKASSLAFKGEATDTGVPATWVIGKPAARAIEALDAVQRLRSRDDRQWEGWLFAPITCGPGAGSAGRTGNTAMTVPGTNRQINRFITWVNSYCTSHGRTDNIPDVGDQPWRLSTRQFRRTLAWFIARRPGGAIAGAIAYRHHSIGMFEGYAGTSESGFRAEVEAEAALARGEHLLAMIDRHEHKTLTGPAAAEAERRLRDLENTTNGLASGFQGIVITDRRRLQRLMKREDPAIYPGAYVTCVYDPGKALCQSHDLGGAADRPELDACKPLACRNVALNDDNLGAWRHELDLINSDIAQRPLLPPLLQTRLEGRRDQVETFLLRTQPTAGSSAETSAEGRVDADQDAREETTQL